MPTLGQSTRRATTERQWSTTPSLMRQIAQYWRSSPSLSTISIEPAATMTPKEMHASWEGRWMRQSDSQRKRKRRAEQHKQALVLNYRIRDIGRHNICYHILEPHASRWFRYPAEAIHENRAGAPWSLGKGFSIIKVIKVLLSETRQEPTKSARFKGAHTQNIEL